MANAASSTLAGLRRWRRRLAALNTLLLVGLVAALLGLPRAMPVPQPLPIPELATVTEPPTPSLSAYRILAEVPLRPAAPVLVKPAQQQDVAQLWLAQAIKLERLVGRAALLRLADGRSDLVWEGQNRIIEHESQRATLRVLHLDYAARSIELGWVEQRRRFVVDVSGIRSSSPWVPR
jgi:hypothetical protein